MPLMAMPTRERIENLTAREKVLLVAFVAALIVTTAAVALTLVLRKTASLKATIAENERILAALKSKKDELREQVRKKREDEKRFEKEPPHLLGLLERLAGEVGVDIPESRDFPDEVIAKRWIHKSAEVRLKKVNLETLTSFLVKIKNQNREFPIAVTKINIKKRVGELNSYDVQMTVSSYTKEKEKKEEKGKGKKEKVSEKKGTEGTAREPVKTSTGDVRSHPKAAGGTMVTDPQGEVFGPQW